MVKELADQDVNKIIALTHQGIKGDKALAEQVPEIDIIVGGHSHTQLYGDGEGYDGPYPIEIANTNGTTRTLIVSSWEKGKYLGDLHVLFDDQGNLIEWGGQPHVVDKTIKPDASFEAKLAEFAEPLDVLRNTRIGESSVLLDGERSNVRSKETNLANLITDAMVERVSEADCFMAIQNGGGIRASIPAGDVTVGQVRTVLPYGNRIATVDLTGAQIKEALENGVSQVEDGAGRFPQVAGMKYVWNPDATAQDQDANVAGERIVSLLVDGDGDGTYEDIDPTATYCVATNNYMLEGGDGYSVFAEGENAYDTGYLLAEAVEDYIGKHSPVNPQIEGRILEGDGTQAQEATVVFSQQNYTVGESGGSATISVTLDMALSEEATVDYATSDDTAEAGSDYTAASGTLTIPAGKTTATFDVSITDDAAVEDDETLKLTLSNPVNVTLGTTKTATLKIMDDEQKVVFAQGNITVKEDVGSVPVTVTLKPASNQVVSVDYATSDGTATAGNDYTAASGTLTFQPGETSQSFNVAVLNDTEMERAETVKLALSNPVNVVLGTAHTATLTIQDDDSFHLRVLHTNDTHAQLEPTNVFGVGDLGGIAQRKTLVDQARTESAADGESVLLLDAGDVFQGTLYFNQYEGLADLWFYNHLQYDAMAVGNHEFDNGPETLAQFINGGSIDADGYAIDGEQVGPAVFPLLSANTDVSNEPLLAGKVKPWVIVERQDEKIGILGLTAQDTAILSSPGDNVTFSDPVAAAEQAVAELEAEGVNKIIALTHIGFSKDKELAAQVNGIDVIVIGHSHTQLYGDGTDAEGPYPTKVTNPAGDDVLIVSSWQKGQYLGNIHLMFDADGEVVSFDGQPYVVDENVESDPTFAAKLQEFGEPIEALNKKVVGETTVLLDGERGNVRSKETNLGNLITDAMLERTQEANAQIAIQNGGGIRASIPAGDVTVGQVRTVLPFGNRIATVDLTGAQVKEALENGVSQVEEGAGRFPQVAGIQYTWTPSATVGSRILSVKVADGSGAFVDIDPEATYRVATNNYLLEGGDGYSVFAAGQNAYDTGYLLAEAVEEYIAAHTPVSPEIEGRIRNVNEESDDEMEAEVDPAKENRVEARERLRINGQDAPRFELDIPSNALPANAAKVRYSKPVTPTNGDLKGSLLYIVLEILDKDGNVIENPTFNPPITLKLRYTDEEASGKEEANFDFAFWNGSKWVAVGPSATCSDCGVQRPVDAENNVVTVKLDHFTEFSLHDGTGLMADEETYPVYLPVVNR
jgi:5'-nucleotidase